MTLLIIEDNQLLAKVIRECVASLFDEIITTHTMGDGWAALVNKHPDVVWLDLALPDSGFEKTINTIPSIKIACPDCMLVVMSGMYEPEAEQRCLSLGADGYLSKSAKLSRGHIIGLLGAGCMYSMHRTEHGHYEGSLALLEKVTQSLSQSPT